MLSILILALLSQCCQHVVASSNSSLTSQPIYLDEKQLLVVPNQPSSAVRSQVRRRKLGSMDSIYINCGSREDYTDYLGRKWKKDSYSRGGFTYRNKDKSFPGVKDEFLYQSERAAENIFSYAIPLEGGQGKYQLVFHFAEIFHVLPNQRVFDVIIEDTKPIYDIDIIAKAGQGHTPITIARNVYVDAPPLDISFLAGVAGLPKVNAIEIHALADGAVLSVFPPLRKAHQQQLQKQQQKDQKQKQKKSPPKQKPDPRQTPPKKTSTPTQETYTATTTKATTSVSTSTSITTDKATEFSNL